ncbi:MAG: glutamate racemase [Clostridia bacterium]|nr:glutamate racemase [Clostridia bacterium]
MKIGFFDSGIGGLTVLHRAFGALPNEEFLYYADEDNVPYGEKSRAEIMELSDRAAEFLIEKGAKIIVIACNTATSAAVASLRERYSVPFIGMEPAVKPAIENADGKRVLVTATPLTIREEKLRNLIGKYDKYGIVDLLPLPRLVGFAERLEFESDAVRAYLAERLGQFDAAQYGQIVLGCTHFNYFKDLFRDILPPHAKVIDGVNGTIKRLISVMGEKDMFEQGGESRVDYYVSGRDANDGESLKRFEKLHRRLELMETI